MKILIAGATGFIGKKVLLRLIKQNYSISIIQSSNKNNLFDENLDEKIVFNILKDVDYNKKFKDINVKKFDYLLFFLGKSSNYNILFIKELFSKQNFIDYLFKGLKKIYTTNLLWLSWSFR